MLVVLSTITGCNRIHGTASEFVSLLHDVCKLVSDNLEEAARKYKARVDLKRHKVIFESSKLVWVVLTRHRLLLHEFNKLRYCKIGQVKVLERINNNAYQLERPDHIKTANVFSVKYFSKFYGVNKDSDSEPDLLLTGET